MAQLSLPSHKAEVYSQRESRDSLAGGHTVLKPILPSQVQVAISKSHRAKIFPLHIEICIIVAGDEKLRRPTPIRPIVR